MRDEVGAQLSLPLELLFEEPGLAVERLPPQLAELYGGELGLRRQILYANFVSALDGVTAVDPAEPGQGGLISGGLPADRFLMGLLRAFADVVLIGAGTLRAEADHVWSPGRIYPPAAAAYQDLREALGREAELPLAVVSGSGELDPALPALAGGLVLTTPAGAERLAARGAAALRIVALGEGEKLTAPAVVAALRSEGYRSILTEGGPQLFGQLAAADLVDELFLTLSPVLAGRQRDGTQIGLVEGTALLPGHDRRGRLLSARRSGSHLFLRYSLPGRDSG